MAPEALVSIRVPAVAERLHVLREVVKDSAVSLGFSESCAQDLMLAVNEACMNVIQHGYRGADGEIELEVRALDAGLEVRIRDTAPPTDMSMWQARDLQDIRPGGLGVHFIRQIIDEMAYLPNPGAAGNCLSLKKYRRHCRKES